MLRMTRWTWSWIQGLLQHSEFQAKTQLLQINQIFWLTCISYSSLNRTILQVLKSKPFFSSLKKLAYWKKLEINHLIHRGIFIMSYHWKHAVQNSTPSYTTGHCSNRVCIYRATVVRPAEQQWVCNSTGDTRCLPRSTKPSLHDLTLLLPCFPSLG